jgi:hypothetical protein
MKHLAQERYAGLRLAPVFATVCVRFLLNSATAAQVSSSRTCIVASTGDLATAIAAVNAGTANSINVAGGTVIAGQSGGGQQFGNGSTSGCRDVPHAGGRCKLQHWLGYLDNDRGVNWRAD